jgi:hypothetical protein
LNLNARKMAAPDGPVKTVPMPLRDFLCRRANIAAERVDGLVSLLQEHWVDDVRTLRECLPSLENKLPAAAFVAISRAIEQAPSELFDPVTATLQGEGGGCGSSSTDAATVPAAAATLRPEHEAILLFQRHQEMEAVKRREAFRADVRRHRQLVHRLRPWPWVISPDSRTAALWEGLVAHGCVFAALVTPFEVGLLDLHDDGLWIANRVVDGLFGLDVLLSLGFLAYREAPQAGGRLVREPRRIACRYARSGALLIDVLAAVPWELVLLLLGAGPKAMLVGADATGVRAESARLVRLAMLLRLLKLGARLGRFGRALSHWERPRAVCFGLVPAHTAVLLPCVLASLALLTHWLTCLWAYVGRTARTPVRTLESTGYGASSWIDHAGLPADVLPHVLYAAALQPAIAAVLGGVATGGGIPAGGLMMLPSWRILGIGGSTTVEGGGATATAEASEASEAPVRMPAAAVLSDGEAYVHAIMLLVGGAAWAAALAVCCCAATTSWPQLGLAAAESAQLEVLCGERRLPRALATRLGGYLEHARAPLARVVTAKRVLSATSSRLQGDVAIALSRPLQRVPYFGKSLGLEPDFLASISLALERAVVGPRDLLSADRLTVIESGRVILRGRILLPSSHFGETMLVTLPVLRDRTPAIALTYVSSVTLSRTALVDVFAAAHYPRAAHAVRRAAVRMALCRAVLLLAERLRAAPPVGQGGGPSPVLLSVKPLRELLLECDQACAAGTSARGWSVGGGGAQGGALGGASPGALSAASLAAAAAAAAKAAARIDRDGRRGAFASVPVTALCPPDAEALAEARLRSQLDACTGRLEAAFDVLAAQWQHPSTTTRTPYRPGTSRDRLGSSRNRYSLSPPRASRTVRARRNHHHARYPAAPTFVVPRNGLPADHMSHELPTLDAVSC